MVRINLRIKFFIFSVVLSLIPLVLLFLILPGQMENSLEKIAAEDLKDTGLQSAYLIGSYLEDIMSDLNLLSDSSVFRLYGTNDADLFKILKKMELFSSAEPGAYDDVTFINPEGLVIASLNHNYRGDWSTKEYFQKALAGEPAVSEAHIISDPFKLVMVFSVPIFNDTGGVVGVLAVQVDIETIRTVLDSVSDQEQLSLQLINNAGKYLINNDPAKILEKISDPGEKCMPRTMRHMHDSGIDVIESYTPITLDILYSGDGCWEIIVLEPAEYALSTVQLVKMQLLLVFVIIFIISLVLSTMLSKSIAGPITSLSKTISHIRSGKSDAKFHIKSNDEIGDLAKDFKELTEELNASKSTLEKTVQQRTEQLKDKVNQLEKFNKMAVGRELKMIELKKKMKELEERK